MQHARLVSPAGQVLGKKHVPSIKQRPSGGQSASLVQPPPAVQLPATHVSPLGQTLPHSPQLFGSVCVSTQAPLHSVCPDGHWQVVPEQTPPVGQVTQVPPQHVSSLLQGGSQLPLGTH